MSYPSKAGPLAHLALASAALLLLLCGTLGGFAAGNRDLTKAQAWAVGEKLSKAALEYARGAKQSTVNDMLADARALAGSMSVTIEPFPAKSPELSARLRDYLLRGGDWRIAAQLEKNFSHSHAALYEVAVMANLLLLANSNQDSLVAEIVKRSREAELPAAIWQPAADLAAQGRSGEVLERAVKKMHNDAIAFLAGEASGITRFSPINVQIELAKSTYNLGEPFSFVVTSDRDCYFLVFTVDPDDKVEIHAPVVSGAYMGHPLLKAGERRQIPVPDAPGRAVITPPAGAYEIGAVCGREELQRFGLSQIELKEPAKAGRRSFQFHLGEKINLIDRNALSEATISYEVKSP